MIHGINDEHFNEEFLQYDLNINADPGELLNFSISALYVPQRNYFQIEQSYNTIMLWQKRASHNNARMK